MPDKPGKLTPGRPLLGKERAGRPEPRLGRASDPTGGTPRLEIPPTLGRTPLARGTPMLDSAPVGRPPLGRAFGSETPGTFGRETPGTLGRETPGTLGTETPGTLGRGTLGKTPLCEGSPMLEMPILGREAALGRTPLGMPALRLRNAPLDRPTFVNALGSATLG